MAEIDDPERKWEVGWDGHERAQLLRMANLSLSQKLLWLEEAEELAAYFQSQREGSVCQTSAEGIKPQEASDDSTNAGYGPASGI